MQKAPLEGRASKLSCSEPAFTRFAKRVNRAERKLCARTLYNGGRAK